MTLKFAMQDKLSGYESPSDAFLLAKEAGFEGVEMNLFQQVLDETLTKSILQASEQSGIPLSAVCGGYRHWIGDFNEDRRRLAVADIQTSLKYVSILQGQGIIAPAAYGMFSKNLPPFQPPRSDAEDREALTDSLKRIAEFAEKYQVKLYLEPLNRYENHMIHTVEQAASILQEVGSDQLQILGDFFHMNIEEADISNTIAVYSEQLGYYHLADSNRQLPGKGHTDFAPAFKQLQQLNYSGYLSLECRIQGDRLEELRNTVSFLRNQMA